jgi:putative addiction module antidote
MALKAVITRVSTWHRRCYIFGYNTGDEAMNATIRKIGNSEGIIIPKDILSRLNLKEGDKLEFIETVEGIMLRRIDDSFERQMKAAREVMDKYKVALQKLAE